MPRFFFDIDDGDSKTRDNDGVELPDRDAARATAVSVLPDIARDELPDGDRRVFLCKVRDESGTVIFIATLSLVAEWVDDKGHGTPP